MKSEDLNTPNQPTWCPGCGNFGTWAAFKNAAAQENWNNDNTALVADIGCHGHIINYVHISSVEGLHGRAVPVATGIKLANSRLNVFTFIGDGGCFGEGGNHFIHACRRNHDLTIILHDNAIYGLTAGQTSPLSPLNFKSKSTPQGNLDEPFNPLALAIASGATFVARAFSSDVNQLTDLIIKANKHAGLAFIDILQPCLTFHKEYTLQYLRENVYYLEESDDKTNKQIAFNKSLEWGLKQIPLGVFYQVETPIENKSLVETPIAKRDVSELFNY